jgi:HEAT repeat protein
VTIDLSSSQQPADLVNAIWAARRADSRELRPHLIELLSHPDPTVREEVISLLFVKWRDQALHERLLAIVRGDPDVGVRGRAAGALAAISDARTQAEDVKVLRDMVLNVHNEEDLRKCCYEALGALVGGSGRPIGDDIDLDEDVDLDWVRAL